MDIDANGVSEALRDGTGIAEEVLLRVEELELLISADRPRRLIEMAQAELSRAVSDAADFWDSQDPGLPGLASSSEDTDIRAAWESFRSLLAASSTRAAEAAALIAGKLAVADDVLNALGVHREYGPDQQFRDGAGERFTLPAVLA